MPAFHIQRSIEINAPAEKVFDTVADFTTWPKWSPWLPIDPDAEVTFSDDPRSLHSRYSWKGEVVGQGEMEHMKLDRPRRLDEEIRFVKPFKSRSDVHFDFQSKGDVTNVTWHMDGKLPFFMFFMKSMMETYVGMDYERGLRMLKECVETGDVLSKVEVLGVESMTELHVIGASDSAAIGEVGPAMEKVIAKVGESACHGNVKTDGELASVYHPVDLKHGRLDFTTGYIATPDGTPPSGLKKVTLPAGKWLRIRHTGSYDNLGNAWSGAYQYARYKKLKVAKRDGFEIYRNDPNETEASDLVTDVHVPLK